jgi:hypothetical protein
VGEPCQDLQALRQGREVERLAGEERGEWAQRAGHADRVGQDVSLLPRGLGRGEEPLSERGHRQLAARGEFNDAEDDRGLAIVEEVPVVDAEELEQGAGVFDAVADRGDELTDVAQTIGLRYVDRAVQPIDLRGAGLSYSGHVGSLARAQVLGY